MSAPTGASKRSLVPVVLVAVAGAAAGAEFHRVFGLRPVVFPVLVASTVPAVIATLGARRRWPVALSIVVSAVSAVVCASFTVFSDQAIGGIAPSPEAVRAIGDAALNGWARLITTTLPSNPDPALVFLPFALTWIAVAAGVEMVERTRARLAGLAPAVAVFVVGAIAGSGGSGATFAVSLVLVAVAAAIASLGEVRTGSDAATGSQRLTARALVGGASVVVVVVLLAAVIGPRAPGVDRSVPYDPREAVQPDIVDREAVDPLALLSGWTAQPDALLFEGTASEPVRWRLAVLDEWDGTAWGNDAVFTTVGRVLPPAPGDASTAKQRPVRQSVSIRELDTPWLPVADRPVELDGQDVFADVESGVVLAPDGSAAAGDYEAVSEVAVNDPEASNLAPTGASEGLLDVPALPPQLVELAAEVTSSANASSPYQRALLLQEFLHDQFTFDPTARSGHSYLRIMQVLGFPVEEAGPRGKATPGTSEQFAVAFAVMARSIGLPTRVAVGFHAGRQLGDGRFTVRGTDAFAWPEVLFDGIGWVAFDPTPVAEGEPPPPEQQKPEDIEDDAADEALIEMADDPNQASTAGSDAGSGEGGQDDGVPWVLVVPLVLVLLAAGYAGSVAFVRRRGRDRLRRGSPNDQVLGAWAAVVHVLGVHGLRIRGSATTLEVVQEVRGRAGDSASEATEGVRRLAVEAAYSGRASDAAAAEAAWAHVDALDGVLTDDMSRRQRLVRSVSPRWFVRPRPAL